ncbi:MAG: pyridoxal-phosphate dependent enzyme [Robiginitalea sp.]
MAASLIMLDGVRPRPINITRDVESLSREVRDNTLSITDRLESLEDIVNLEVGDTALTRLRNLERDYGIRQLFIKFEGDNPTGTQKDRIAFAQVYDAIRRGYDTVALATCGNYGVAMAVACSLAGLSCRVYIPASYHTERIEEMKNFHAQIIRLPGTYEEVVTASSQEARVEDYYDANPGGSNTPLQLKAYSEIAFEIYDQLRDAPKFVACPVSNGTLLAGVFRGFVNLYKRGKTSRIPHFIAGSSSNKNPIVSSFNKGLKHCEDLDPAKIRETEINEPLINWHSFDGDEAVYALRESGGFAVPISDQKMKGMASHLLKNDGIKVLPAATAGLIALLQKHQLQPMEHDRFVTIVTARN